MFLINTSMNINFMFLYQVPIKRYENENNRISYLISVRIIKKDYVKTFIFILYSCTLIVMPLMVFALIRLKKRVLKIEQDRIRMEKERWRERERKSVCVRQRIWQSCVT